MVSTTRRRAVLALTAIALVTGVACTHNPAAPLPAGMRAVDFQGVQVWVPADWPTFTDQHHLVDCDLMSRPGVYLGPLLPGKCAISDTQIVTSLSMQPLTGATYPILPTTGRAEKINGVQVTVYDLPGILVAAVPNRQVLISIPHSPSQLAAAEAILGTTRRAG
jgi:hypothetical protein